MAVPYGTMVFLGYVWLGRVFRVLGDLFLCYVAGKRTDYPLPPPPAPIGNDHHLTTTDFRQLESLLILNRRRRSRRIMCTTAL